jgi:hypothetical protein
MDFRELKALSDRVNKFVQTNEGQKFGENCTKELAARLLEKVIPRTPVGVYPSGSGKVGGTLRRGWTCKTHEEAENGTGQGQDPLVWASQQEVKHKAGYYELEIVNPVNYASYVEYGHRQQPGRYVPAIGKKLKKGFVEGKHMLSASENELKSVQDAILAKRLDEKLKELMGDD